jgi:hypothetical protein
LCISDLGDDKVASSGKMVMAFFHIDGNHMSIHVTASTLGCRFRRARKDAGRRTQLPLPDLAAEDNPTCLRRRRRVQVAGTVLAGVKTASPNRLGDARNAARRFRQRHARQ